MERFNRTYRTEVLDAYVFTHLEDVRTISDDFFLTYNTERPHDSLGRVPPLTFLPSLTCPQSLVLDCQPDGGSLPMHLIEFRRMRARVIESLVRRICRQ